MSSSARPMVAGTILTLALLLSSEVHAATLDVLQPLNRSAYQTNEIIDLSVVRSDSSDLKAGDLVLSLADDSGSKLAFTFPINAVPVKGTAAQSTEHLHLNAALLRPGAYTVDVAADGANAKSALTLHSHIRKSSFRLVNWGRADKPALQAIQGEDSFGYNLYYGGYANDDGAHFITAGVDFMSCCTMSGAHQMDLRAECDWSDPYVTKGGTQRVVRRAFEDRTRGNVQGVHFYDEPGLTWNKDPATGESTPHWVPPQRRAFESAFGREAPDYKKIDSKDPKSLAEWKLWANWKLAFMDSAWKEAQFGVSQVRSDYLSITQSQYGATAFTDGYYFNVVRSLPITSGHGGYDDFGLAYFNPSMTLALARARDYAKPNWYLPTWYGSTPPDRFRLEQYLSFITNIQGMMSPPDLEPATNVAGRQGIVESNHVMAKLGTVFTTMPVTLQPVAMLYSLSDNIQQQAETKGELSYAHASLQGKKNNYTYLAGEMLQYQFMFIVDEDVVDGTLAANHKAVILSGIKYLDPKVTKGLERFAAGGGLVLMTSDCTAKIAGAIDIGATAKHPDEAKLNELIAQKKWQEANVFNTAGKLMKGSEPVAKALKAQLEKAGIKPIFTSSNSQIVAGRQASGDIEYLFAVNASYDDQKGEMNSIKAADAKIELTADGRPIYDAIAGGAVTAFTAQGDKLAGTFRFGPGQMRAWARTARPIKKISALPVSIRKDLAADREPMSMTVGAVLLDDAGGVLAGSAPLHVTVIDPLGAIRHEVFRATRDGMFSESFPLAANDPAGEWKVIIRELLSNSIDQRTFAYAPAPVCGAVAGAQHRAVFFTGDDQNVFRFARVHHAVTIAKGTSAFNGAAADRLVKILAPWGITAKIVNAADIAKPRELSAEQKATWSGLDFGKVADQVTPGLVGFSVEGPVILIGTPDDNEIIKWMTENKRRYLAYEPTKQFPGAGRGYFAWQRDAIGKGQESVTLIGYDAEGMAEAVGSFYEAVQGLDPLTRWAPPSDNTIESAKTGSVYARAKRLWEALVPDRVIAMKVEGNALIATSSDGSETTLSADGKTTGAKVGAAADFTPPAPLILKNPLPGRLPKISVAIGDKTAVGYWGGTIQVVDAAGKSIVQDQLPQDITAMAVCEGKLIVGLATGQIVAIEVK